MKDEAISLDYFPQTPQYFANPYPFYDRLRGEDPVHWSDIWGSWVLSRHCDVVTTLRDPRFSSRRVEAYMKQLPEAICPHLKPLGRHMSQWLAFQDPPEHTRLRSLVSKAFTPRMVEALRPRIQRIVDDLIDAHIETGAMDLMANFSYPLPATVIAEMLGVPLDDCDQFKDWSDDIVAFLGTGRADAQSMQLGQESLLALTDYFRELVARRRSEPADDLVSSLLAAQEAGQKLTEEELLILCATLLTAGHETTTYLIGNAMLALLRHPAEMEKLRQDPSLAPTAVEESLRYDPSIQRVWRVATEDLEWGGKEIRRGQLVVQLLGAANRDPERFAEPHTFNMARTDLTHVAFGHGIHFCLGAPLARLEAQIALVALTSRLRDLRLANDGPLQWHENLAFRGLKALPVAFG